eukprot:jgi/Galph1/5068/GphlegSOOS_G3744.1
MKLTKLDRTASFANFSLANRKNFAAVRQETLSSLSRLDMGVLESEEPLLRRDNLPKSAPCFPSAEERLTEKEAELIVQHSFGVDRHDKNLSTCKQQLEVGEVTYGLTRFVTDLTPRQKILNSSSFRPLDFSNLLYGDPKNYSELCTPRQQAYYNTKIWTKIRPYLYTGGETVAKDIDFLLSNNIRFIVNLSHLRYPNILYDERFRYFPFRLCDNESQEIIAVCYQVEAIIHEAITENVSVLVHCQKGISRSIAVIIACLMMREQRSFDSVYDEVRKLRPVSAPNGGFIDTLIQLQDRLQYGARELRVYRFSYEDNYVNATFIPSHHFVSNSLTGSTLCSEDVYLIQPPMKSEVHLWIGKRTNEQIIKKATVFAERLVKYEVCTPLHKHADKKETREEDDLLLEHEGNESSVFKEFWMQICFSSLVVEG